MSFPDYQVARERMVREQVFEKGIKDRHVLRALLEVPRHMFVDPVGGPEAYTEHAFPIGFSQTISKPYMVAYLAEQLLLGGSETVLEIGTGSGYQAAVLAQLAKVVYSIERIPELAGRADERIRRLRYQNIHIRVADGADGWPDFGPFDRILLTAAAADVPESLLSQVRDGGFLLGPVFATRREQEIVRLTRTGDRFGVERLKVCSFVPLVRGVAAESLKDPLV
jgi:protein-L-isoaspartate(D-aspartate) O-methyltransferase